MKRIGPIEEAIFEGALALDGTLTGEHGIGLSKRAYLSLELKGRELAISRDIKRAFDPNGILNPGKILQ
jgi:FAD/FMN-containing dehydrogenase